MNEAIGAIDTYGRAFSGVVALLHEQSKTNGLMIDAATGIEDICEEFRRTQQEKMARQTAMANTLTIGGTVMAIAAGLLLAFLLTRTISKPLLRAIVRMGKGADHVASASDQISSASRSLAQGSSEQAASLEETAASREEMASMAKQNAEYAVKADALVSTTEKLVTEANVSMEALTRSIGSISEASEETRKIVKTIDEIAFQTNRLALNAAVEAARAGEAGAGFAVVAGDVRSLAMRSAEAARQTADLIDGTSGKVKTGATLVEKTNSAFGQVVENTGKVTHIVNEIAAASREQADGVEQINRAVSEMDKVTQQNAANAEESASSFQELNAQSETIRSLVNELTRLVNESATRNAVAEKRPSPGGERFEEIGGSVLGIASEALHRLKRKIPGGEGDMPKGGRHSAYKAKDPDMI
jgi:methyl-accepting chemotaxis protein